MADAEAHVRSTVGKLPVFCDQAPMCTKEGVAKAENLIPREGDIFISTFSKTGTTFLQQLLHQLRTGGHIEFDEITEECPWYEVWPSLGADLNEDQRANPRCFKSHQPLSRLSHLEEHGAKFICTIRDPERTTLSYYKFLHSHGLPFASMKNINDFVKSSFITGVSDGSGSMPLWGINMWDQYVEYWNCRNFENVEVFAFEHLVKETGKYFDLLAKFMGIEAITGEKKETILKYCSKKWMSENVTLFDDHAIGNRMKKLKEAANSGLPDHDFKAVAKVGHEVSPDLVVEYNEESKAIFEKMWKEKIEPATGFKTYEDLKNALIIRDDIK